MSTDAPTSAIAAPVMRSVTQPPAPNLSATVATSRIVVNTSPTPLTASLRRHVGSFARTASQCSTMPSCDNENVRNTLIE